MVGDAVHPFGQARQPVVALGPGDGGVIGAIGEDARTLQRAGVQRIQHRAFDRPRLGLDQGLSQRGQDAHDHGAGLADPRQEAFRDVGEGIGPHAGAGHADVPLAHHPGPVGESREHHLASHMPRTEVGVQIRVIVFQPLKFRGLRLQPHDAPDVDMPAAPLHGLEGEPDEACRLVLAVTHAQAVGVEEGVREHHVGVRGVIVGAVLLLLHEAVRHELLDGPRHEGLALHEVAEVALLVRHGTGVGVEVPLVLHGDVAIDGRLVGEGCGRECLARLFPHPRHVEPAFRAQHAPALALHGDVVERDRLHRDHHVVEGRGPGGQLERRGGDAGITDAVSAQGVGSCLRRAQREPAQVVGEDASDLGAFAVDEHDHRPGQGGADALLEHPPAHDLRGGRGGGGRAGQGQRAGQCEQRAGGPAAGRLLRSSHDPGTHSPSSHHLPPFANLSVEHAVSGSVSRTCGHCHIPAHGGPRPRVTATPALFLY